MADQNITELPIKTNSGVASTDYMLGIDSEEGYQILVRDVAKYIVENYNGSTLAGSAQSVQSALSELNSNSSDLNDIIYPNENVIVKTVETTTQANANSYYGISLLKPNNSYRIVLTISNTTHLANIRTSKAESGSGNVDNVTSSFTGDSFSTGKTLIYTPTVEGIKYLQVQFNSTYVSDEADITIVVYDYTKEQETAIAELQTEIDNKQTQIDNLEYVIDLDRAYNLLPPSGYEVGKHISVDGTISSDSVSILSDYIELDKNQSYICNFTKTASVVYGSESLTGYVNTFDRFHFCFFDENKIVVPFTGETTAISKAIPSGAKYIRVTILSEIVYPLAMLIYGNYDTQPLVRIVDYKTTQQRTYESPNTGYEGFTMVMFGDSITHGSLSAGDSGISYVDYANDYLHSNIINVGFGGTRMTYTLADAGLFCFYHLCECIVSNDADIWDDLDAYALVNTTYAPHLATLKAIDWTKVNAIGLLYGANDYTSNTPVGTSYNETVTNYDGACAYGLKLLLSKYPHLQVMILSPFDRELTTDDPATMTDRVQNSAGLIMSDYGNALENVVSRFHCPLVRTDKTFGVSQYNILTYAPDGTHPRANIAQKRLGRLFSQMVKTYLSPF